MESMIVSRDPHTCMLDASEKAEGSRDGERKKDSSEGDHGLVWKTAWR